MDESIACVLTPDSKTSPVYSSPDGSFFVVHKKSIVLYLAGFHFNECCQVILVFGGCAPGLLIPTPRLLGVKMNPSVSYGYRPSKILSCNFLQAWNIVWASTIVWASRV